MQKNLQMGNSLVKLAVTFAYVSVNVMYHHFAYEDQVSNSFHLLAANGLTINDEVQLDGKTGTVVGLPGGKVAIEFDKEHHKTVSQDELRKQNPKEHTQHHSDHTSDAHHRSHTHGHR